MGATAAKQGMMETGIGGLDEVLRGGLPPRAVHLVTGEPGTGKTTLAMQFLMAGRDAGERVLFVTLSQSEADLRRIARSHGFTLDGFDVREVSPLEVAGVAVERQTVVHTADVELADLMQSIRTAIDEVEPTRVVFDSLFELRLLAGDSLGYRRELVLLKEYVTSKGATSLFLDYSGAEIGDRQLEGLAHGVIKLEMRVPQFGTSLRRLSVSKMRGRHVLDGYHDLAIRTGGIAVFPRVIPELIEDRLSDERMSSGIERLDYMLGGGLEPGTTCLIVGQAGTGKSTLATALAHAAGKSGKKAAMFLFEEHPEVFRRRSRELNLDLTELEDTKAVMLTHFNPAEISPGEFANAVVTSVERDGADVVVIDSLTGYIGALPSGRDLISQLHSLLSYLARQNVLVVMTMAQHGLLGGEEHMDVDTSYLADCVVHLRRLREGDDLVRTVTVLKKRHGDHETAVSELDIGDGTVEVYPRPGN